MLVLQVILLNYCTLANEPNKATWPAKNNIASWRAKLTGVLDFY
jgi:hypothetical protein